MPPVVNREVCIILHIARCRWLKPPYRAAPQDQCRLSQAGRYVRLARTSALGFAGSAPQFGIAANRPFKAFSGSGLRGAPIMRQLAGTACQSYRRILEMA